MYMLSFASNWWTWSATTTGFDLYTGHSTRLSVTYYTLTFLPTRLPSRQFKRATDSRSSLDPLEISQSWLLDFHLHHERREHGRSLWYLLRYTCYSSSLYWNACSCSTFTVMARLTRKWLWVLYLHLSQYVWLESLAIISSRWLLFSLFSRYRLSAFKAWLLGNTTTLVDLEPRRLFCIMYAHTCCAWILCFG